VVRGKNSWTGHPPFVKPPIFIVGPHRAGSTLWHNLIAMCPGVMRLTDPRFLSNTRHKDFRYFLRTAVGDLALDPEVDKMVELCFAKKDLPGLDSTFWRFENIKVAEDRKLKQEISRRIKQSDRSLGAIAKILIEEITRFGGCARACVKFPVDIGHMPELLTWFPDCKIAHITRDPRAMAMSKTNDPSGTALRVLKHPRLARLIRKLNVYLVIAEYRQAARVHQQFQNRNNYSLFRYEDLLAEPEKTLKSLCQFVEEDFTEDLLHPEKGIHEHQPSSLTGKQQKAFDMSAAVRWQDVIPAFDKWLITVLTKRSMRILGYDPATHPIFQVNQRSLVGMRTQAV
jgi:Sulfotransferase family